MPRKKAARGAPARRSARFAEQDEKEKIVEEHANRVYVIGDRVEARWDGRPEWHAGKVIAMNDDKTYDVLYDDGDDELNVDPKLMKREGEAPPPEAKPKRKKHTRPQSPRPGTPTSDGDAKPKRKKEPHVIPKQRDVLMEALATEEDNRRWLIKQKRDALANEDTGIVRAPKALNHPRRYSGRDSTCVNFPKADTMPDILHADQRPPPVPNTTCCITGKKARYKCPKTGLPYHDLAAFKELRRRNGLSDGPLRTNTLKDYELVDADPRINREKRHPAELPQRPPVEDDLADAWTRAPPTLDDLRRAT